MELERLRTDGETRSKVVSAKSSAAKVVLADAQRAVEALETSDAGKAARSLQSLDEGIPRLEAEISAIKTRVEKLRSDKLAFAKAKQFKEAGQAKKDIDTAEEQLKQLEARLVHELATAASTTAQDEAKAYATQLLAAKQAAAAGATPTPQTGRSFIHICRRT
jgi:predicted  nucleic acid-binding Zn-ribbon protein